MQPDKSRTIPKNFSHPNITCLAQVHHQLGGEKREGGNSCPIQPCNTGQLEQMLSWLGPAEPCWAAWKLVMAVHGGDGLCHSWELLLTKGLQC